MKQRIWLITGASSGLGKALAEQVLATEDFVLATFRKIEEANQFTAQNTPKGRGICLDITQPAQIEQVYKELEWEFGGIDVLVNNAGYGFAGAVEEANDGEIRRLMETHYHGPLLLSQLVLPGMRKKGSGHIVQISSHGGVRALPGFGLYNASKFALEGFSEALWAEVKPLGIHIILVEPGPFRTGFASHRLQMAAQYLPEYASTAGQFRERLKGVDGNQEGDPIKAAAAIWHATQLQDPPLRLPLGKIALASLQFKCDWLQKDMAFWQDIAANAVF